METWRWGINNGTAGNAFNDVERCCGERPRVRDEKTDERLKEKKRAQSLENDNKFWATNWDKCFHIFTHQHVFQKFSLACSHDRCIQSNGSVCPGSNTICYSNKEGETKLNCCITTES